MKRLITNHYALITILVLAALLRLWNLGSIPPSLTNDEAALGYNAYSILKTGRDEHGALFPIIFQSFGDWKPGLYVYAAVPGVAVFGLNEFATRLPGAISGVIAVWLIYLVVGELFRTMGPAALHPTPTSSPPAHSGLSSGSKTGGLRALERGPRARHPSLAQFAAFLLAISPWHIQFSRGAWEVGVALTLTLAGIYFFLRSLRDRPQLLILSALFFGLTLITYQGAKLSTGLVVLGLLILWWKKLFATHKRTLIMSGLVGLLVAFPAILSLFTGKAGRLEVFSVFSYPRPPEVVEHILSQGNETVKDITYILFHNEPLNFARGVLGRWMNHYSTRFLFFEGDWSGFKHSVPHAGVILLIDVLFLIAGFVVLIRMRVSPGALFVWFWLLVSPLPAALSRDSIQAVRAFNEVIPLTIILALGGAFLWERIQISKSKTVLLSIFMIVYFANFAYWLDQYFIHMPIHNAQYWQYGYKQVVQMITPIQTNYKDIVVAQSYDQPYIYFLFYQKYDPFKYKKSPQITIGSTGTLDVGLVERLDNILFVNPDWHRDRGKHGALVVGNPEQIPPEDSSDTSQFKLTGEVKYPNGQTAFRLIEVL